MLESDFAFLQEAAEPASQEALHTVEQFLYREARLLDERRLTEWLALVADDCRYWIPTRTNRAGTRQGPEVSVASELGGGADLAYVEDDKLQLAARVLRLGTGQAWGENPPSRTRRIVSNIEAFKRGKGSGEPRELVVYANLLVYRTRKQSDEHWFVAGRSDLLREGPKGLTLARRKVVLDTTVLRSPNLSLIL